MITRWVSLGFVIIAYIFSKIHKTSSGGYSWGRGYYQDVPLETAPYIKVTFFIMGIVSLASNNWILHFIIIAFCLVTIIFSIKRIRTSYKKGGMTDGLSRVQQYSVSTLW